MPLARRGSRTDVPCNFARFASPMRDPEDAHDSDLVPLSASFESALRGGNGNGVEVGGAAPAADPRAECGADEDGWHPENQVADPRSRGEEVEDDVGRIDGAPRWVAIEEEDAMTVHPYDPLGREDREQGGEAGRQCEGAGDQPEAERSGQSG